jgi:isopentenyl-diphosphate delta-isomerase
VHVFEGTLDRPLIPDAVDPDEVMAVRWVSREALAAEVARDPSRFTPWLRIYLDRWPELALRGAA